MRVQFLLDSVVWRDVWFKVGSEVFGGDLGCKCYLFQEVFRIGSVGEMGGGLSGFGLCMKVILFFLFVVLVLFEVGREQDEVGVQSFDGLCLNFGSIILFVF